MTVSCGKTEWYRGANGKLGIWECQSSQAVVEFVRQGIAAKQGLDKICERMMDKCLAPEWRIQGVGCDNMTMIIIGFLQGRSKEQWYEEIARRVVAGDGPLCIS